MTLLDIVIALPLLGFLITLLLPKGNGGLIKNFTFGYSVITFLASLLLIPTVLSRPGQFSWVTDMPWIDTPAIRYHVGMDGVSLWLVILATFLTPLAILLSRKQIVHRVKEFFAFLLLLEFGLVGVFVAVDLFLFYVFWEVALVPMYFLIGIWGGEGRIRASVKFFIYTMVGSVLMLAGILYLYVKSGTFDYPAMLIMIESGKLSLTLTEELVLFVAFFLAFAVKAALFPVHTWLPDAYAASPTAATVMLAAVMSKMGTYGILRFCLSLFPNAAHQHAKWIAVLAIIGIIYGALVALVQPNIKRLVAYSSVSHLGFIMLGLFAGNQWGLDGAAYQMLAHAISTGALFMLAGFMEDRQGSLEISAYGGVATPAPWLATVFVVASLASIGLPMLSNFVGEYLVMQGAAQTNIWWAVFAASGVVLSACYMLWMVQRTFYGPASEKVQLHMYDLRGREWACVLPLVVMMIWMGVYTQSFLPSISASNQAMLERTEPQRTDTRVANPAPGGMTPAKAAEVAQRGY